MTEMPRDGSVGPEADTDDIIADAPEVLEDAALACLLAGKYLLNTLRSVGIEPDEIGTQAEALDYVWPTKWAYDAWCAWHACRIIVRRAGLDVDLISRDRREGWRTSGQYVDGKAIVGPS